MKKAIMLFILIIITITAFTDEITLKDGRSYKGEIIGKKGFDIFFKSNGEYYQVSKGSIEDIIFEGKFMTELIFLKNDFMNSTPTGFTILKADNQKLKRKSPKLTDKYNNLYLFPVSILAFAIAWDSFSEASDISDIINDTPESISTTDLESQKQRKTFVGCAASIAFIINTIYCFDRVEISAKEDFLTVNYKF